ncbi:MAG: IS630 family transposase, partial [Actinobacteria bacterium]|nr:IS630 family transposase [Actinomycetota bacterium]
RATVVLASAGGNTVEAIARLVQTSPDRVREMIHRFNELGLVSLDPQWAGGRPRRITTEDEAFIVATATERPEKLGRPFTRWSLRKLRQYLGDNPVRVVRIGKERLRQILDRHGVTFQRTKTWKESNDPHKEQKLDRIEEVLREHPDRVFAFDEFGPLAVHPVGGCCWAARTKPQRLRANYHKHCGVRQFHACYSVGDDTMWGVVRAKKGTNNTLAAIRSCRAARPDSEPIYVVLDNLSAHKAAKIRDWCAEHNVELCFTPTYSSWANPIECHFGPLRDFVLNNSDHSNHSVLTKRLHAYLRWRNTHGSDPALRERLRRERARLRSERQRRWGRAAAPIAPLRPSRKRPL